MSKIVYIIPGFSENTSIEGYQQIMKSFKSKDFKVIPIEISWKYKVMSNYIDEFCTQLSHKESDDVYIFGFSFGAMIALISAIKIKPKMLFLCSLSPYFKEDLELMKVSWKHGIGRKRMEDLKNFSFQELSKNINSKTLLIVGEKEPSEIHKRTNSVHKRVKNSKLFIVKNSKHNISQKEYINKLQEIIFKL